MHTYLLIRDDKQSLYGFTQTDERTLFQELLKISKIGPKAALAILSSMDIHQALESHYLPGCKCFTKYPGISKKTAEAFIIRVNQPSISLET